MAKTRKNTLSREERLRLQDEDVRLSCLIIENVRNPFPEFCREALDAFGFDSADLSDSDLVSAASTLACFEEMSIA